MISFLVISARIVALLPAGFGLVIGLITPTYFRPMVTSQVGFALLAVGATCVAGGYGLMELAIRLMKRRHLLVAVMAAVLSLLIEFFTVWIILLGPALIILATSAQPR